MSIHQTSASSSINGPRQVHFRVSERDYRVLHIIAEQHGEHVAAILRRMLHSVVNQWLQSQSPQASRGGGTKAVPKP
jgi:hypothetical protein